MSGATYTTTAPVDVALPPPPGVIPDFQDPFTLRPYHNVAASLSLTFVSIFLMLRMYTKIRLVKECRLEDYACILGFLGYIGFSINEFFVINAKGGAHQWNVTTEEMTRQYRYTNYEDICYPIAMGATKVSIILLLIRLFCPRNRDPFYWTLQGLNIMNTLFHAIFFFIPIFLCKPRNKIWEPNHPGKCLQIFVLYIASAVFNVFSDLLMLFVPLYRIWNLSISKSRKLGISAVFFTGSLVIAASTVRMAFCILLMKNVDYSYVKAQSAIMTHAEIGCALICSSLFVLPRLYRHLASIPAYGTEAYTTRQRSKFSADNSGLENGIALSDHELSRQKGSAAGQQHGWWMKSFEKQLGGKGEKRRRRGDDDSLTKEWNGGFGTVGSKESVDQQDNVAWRHQSLEVVRPPYVPKKDIPMEKQRGYQND